MLCGWLIGKSFTVAFFRWGRRDPVIVKGRCASSSSSCYETPAKGGDPKSMSQLPHRCGPERMGLGWKDGMKPNESFSYQDWIPGEQGGLREEKEQKSCGNMKVVTIGGHIVVVQHEAIEDDAEGEAIDVRSQFEEEGLKGPRRPNMMEVFQYNCDEPGAGKHTRLVMEDFRKVPPPGLLWCGTSLSAQAIDISQCSSRSRFQVHFCKAFTINSIGATYKPEINAETMLKTQFKGEKILVLELGCNEVTNASSEMEAKQLIDGKMEALVQLANDLYKREKLQKVILLNRLPRCDKRAELSLYSDTAMQNALRAKGASDIEIRDLVFNCESKLLFGFPGERDHHGRKTDGLHFRGADGPRAFNKAAIRLLKSL